MDPQFVPIVGIERVALNAQMGRNAPMVLRKDGKYANDPFSFDPMPPTSLLVMPSMLAHPQSLFDAANRFFRRALLILELHGRTSSDPTSDLFLSGDHAAMAAATEETADFAERRPRILPRQPHCQHTGMIDISRVAARPQCF